MSMNVQVVMIGAARHAEIMRELDTIDDVADDLEGDVEYSLDKAWHGVQFLLTGSAWDDTPPLGFLVGGGTDIGDDAGYGPVRGFGPDEVRALAAALATVDEAALRARFDPARMDQLKIYPTVWVRDGAENLPWLLSAFTGLRDFVVAGAERGDAMLVWCY